MRCWQCRWASSWRRSDSPESRYGEDSVPLPDHAEALTVRRAVTMHSSVNRCARRFFMGSLLGGRGNPRIWLSEKPKSVLSSCKNAGGSSRGRSPPRIGSNAPQSLAQQGVRRAQRGFSCCEAERKSGIISGCQKVQTDFLDAWIMPGVRAAAQRRHPCPARLAPCRAGDLGGLSFDSRRALPSLKLPWIDPVFWTSRNPATDTVAGFFQGVSK